MRRLKTQNPNPNRGFAYRIYGIFSTTQIKKNQASVAALPGSDIILNIVDEPGFYGIAGKLGGILNV